MITRRSLVQAAAAAGATHWLSAANAQTTNWPEQVEALRRSS